MMIKEFFLTRYGPLRNKSYSLAPTFNILWGQNEDGKTLTIDALVKLLLGRKVRKFDHPIDRVEEAPEGYCVIEMDGKEVKLPEKGDLNEIAAITPAECRNVFIIRDSDLSIAGEGEFYTTLTDRLVGLRTQELAAIKEALLKIGRITPGGQFRDTKEDPLKARVDEANELREKIKALAQEMEKARCDELEAEEVRLQEKLEALGQKIEQLEDARRREQYQKGKEALAKLQEVQQAWEGLKKYKDDEAQRWRDAERELQKAAEKKRELQEQLQAREEEIKGVEGQLRKKKQELHILDSRKVVVDGATLKVHQIQEEAKVLAQQGVMAKAYLLLGVITALLLVIAISGCLFAPSLVFYLATPVFFVATIPFWWLYLQRFHKQAHIAGLLEEVKGELARIGLHAATIEDVYERLQEFAEELTRGSDAVQREKLTLEKLQEKIAELRDRDIPAQEKTIAKAKDEIEKIKDRSGVSTPDEYRKLLKEKSEKEKEIEKERGILQSLFGAKERLEESIPYWEEAIRSLASYKDKAPGVKYEERTLENLKKEKDKCEEDLQGVREQMKGFKERLQEVEKKANAILQPEMDYLPCQTSLDLKYVQQRLDEFSNGHETRRDNVIKAIEIFGEMEGEEREKVAELFGGESPVSTYFAEITGGLYQEVLFDQQQGGIQVKRRDGRILEAEKLSGGAYDQLYLAIRLALGERLLAGKKGFFIMDDPFVKADPERLARQLEVLLRIARLGWQVIYFSAKGEVKEALQEAINKGEVQYMEIQGIFDQDTGRKDLTSPLPIG